MSDGDASESLTRMNARIAALRAGDGAAASRGPAPDVGGLGGGVASRSGPPSRGGGGGGAGGGAGGDLGEDAEALKSQLATLSSDLERRKASYCRRERKMQTRIQVLESELNKDKGGGPSATIEDLMGRPKELHAKIMGHISHVQEQTQKILQEQERDLLRAFRARLFDVQTELEKAKSRVEDGASQYIEKNRQLEKELDWAKEMADRLDRHNQSLQRENGRLKTQFKTQEDDREYLIRQLVAAKKDNVRLRQEVQRLKSDVEGMQAASEESSLKPEAAGTRASPLAGASTSASGPPVEDNRYKDIIGRLKKLLEVERKNLRAVRTQYATELQQRTELEVFLRQCIEDVSSDIASRRRALLTAGDEEVGEMHAAAAAARKPGAGGGDGGDGLGAVALSTFEASDREKVMELLLSQQRVINLLYSKTFPPRGGSKLSPLDGPGSITDAGGEEEEGDVGAGAPASRSPRGGDGGGGGGAVSAPPPRAAGATAALWKRSELGAGSRPVSSK